MSTAPSGERPNGPLPRNPELVFDPQRKRHVGRTTVRVRYAETDRMGIAYNAHYLTWFEIGRTEFMRSAGVPYREVESRGINLPLVETSFRLRAPLRYDDVLVTNTWIERVRSRAVSFAYEVFHNGRLVAGGQTVHAFVRASDNRSVTCPPWLQEKLVQLSG